jgi:hypothetical protein
MIVNSLDNYISPKPFTDKGFSEFYIQLLFLQVKGESM